MKPTSHLYARDPQLKVRQFPVIRRSGLLILLGAALSISPLFQTLANAQSVTAAASVSVGFGHGESPGADFTSSGNYVALLSESDPDTVNLQFGSGSANVTAVDLNSGSLLPDLHAIATPEAMGNIEAVSSVASFQDNLSFQSPAPNTVKVFHLNFLLTGSLTGNSQAIFNVQWGDIDSNGVVITADGSVTQELTLAVPSSDLTPASGDSVGGLFNIELSAGADNTVPNSLTLESSSSDFSNTVQLISADALDANGDVVAGSFTDGNQILFPANTIFVSTPEPRTALLLAPSLLLLALWRPKRLPARVC
jgi:hypothetical protein